MDWSGVIFGDALARLLVRHVHIFAAPMYGCVSIQNGVDYHKIRKLLPSKANIDCSFERHGSDMRT